MSGCGVALVVGIIFIIIFYVAQNSVFSGNGKTIFEGLLMLFASYLITLLGFAMLKIRGYEAKWEHKLQRQAAAQAAAQTDTTVRNSHAEHITSSSRLQSMLQLMTPSLSGTAQQLVLQSSLTLHLALSRAGQL